MSANAPGWIGRLYARWTALGLTPRILLGLAIGILIGLFFGEDARVLQGAAWRPPMTAPDCSSAC